MRLHILGLAHTITSPHFSHCAFTGKILRFIPMMQSVGYEVVHYGNGSPNLSCRHVEVFSETELQNLLGHSNSPENTQFFDKDINNSELRLEYNRRLKELLKTDLDDIICLPFGWAHNEALVDNPNIKVETGVGYVGPQTTPFRVFESNVFMHYLMGKYNTNGSDYHWVIPNYFNLSEWSTDLNSQGEYFLYFGRIMESKGLSIIVELAKRRPDLEFLLCGQGDPTPYMTVPNIKYHLPVYGENRKKIYENAKAVLMPTRYIEPFGGVSVEAQLCGKPVFASSFGAFGETIDNGKTGFLCRTLGDWMAALNMVNRFNFNKIRRWAEQFDMYILAQKYDLVFKQVQNLRTTEGWYSSQSGLRYLGE